MKPRKPKSIARRNFLNWGVHGLGATALSSMLQAEEGGSSLPGFEPKAKRAINICLVGGLSQVDSFDYKPALEKFHGKTPPGKRPEVFFGKVGRVRRNDWKFQPRGRSGLWISELFPHIAGVADELTLIRSMHSETGNHTPALFLSNSGFPVNGFPSLGSWLSYGLGNLSDSLPTFVVLSDARVLPAAAPQAGATGSCRVNTRASPSATGSTLFAISSRRGRSRPMRPGMSEACSPICGRDSWSALAAAMPFLAHG